MSAAPILRAAVHDDVPAIADIWRTGWRDGHLGNVPDELLAARTDASFAECAAARLDETTVAEVRGEVAGFTMVVGDEVEQVYVDGRHRGTGTAIHLLDAAERRVRDAGYETAWLAVVAGNERARGFYAKRGWEDDGLFDHQAPGPDGPIRVPSHRYVKRLP